MRYFPAQIGADDQSIPFHLAEVLGQHLLRRLREESVQFAGPRWPFLKPTKNSNLPFSLNQRQMERDGLIIRTDRSGKVLHVEYCLSKAHGLAVYRLLDFLATWSAEYRPQDASNLSNAFGMWVANARSV